MLSNSVFNLALGLLLLILFGLLSLRNGHLSLPHIRFLCSMWLISITPLEVQDIALCLLTVLLLQSFHSYGALLFLLLAYVGQLYMMHACNLVSFYICLEAQTLCVVVLCGLLAASSSFSVEAALKFLIQSAMVSGMALYWFSSMYLRTGSLEMTGHFWILLVMLFKLGVAPMHFWSVDLYSSVPKNLVLYLSTAPKLSLFTFWAYSFDLGSQNTSDARYAFLGCERVDFSLGVFVLLSILIGSIGAYTIPALRSLFAYSTINEIGLLLLAVETAGFHTLYQHLSIYIVSQLLLWNLTDKRLFALCAVSLAGLPPLSGFFGKAWIFWHTMSVGAFSLLAAALICTVLSLVYYLRVIRLFWPVPVHTAAKTSLTSACTVALVFAPAMLVKPLFGVLAI